MWYVVLAAVQRAEIYGQAMADVQPSAETVVRGMYLVGLLNQCLCLFHLPALSQLLSIRHSAG